MNDAQEQDRLAARGLDVTVPNVARIYDYILGGKDNFDADRAAAAQILAVIPGGSGPARMNRAFLGRVVHFLAAERGIRQFLDIGSGLPTASNVHEIAQAADPDARVVYVDSDPVVVLHAQAILEDRAKGVAAVRGDLRDPDGIIASPAVRELIDFSQPVAVLLFAVLHFVQDADDPRALLARFADVMAPGSALALSHITDENIDEEAARAGRAVYQSASAPIMPRSRAQIEGLFDGLDLLPPGVVGISHWPGPDPGGAALHFYGGVAVKPAALPATPRGQHGVTQPVRDLAMALEAVDASPMARMITISGSLGRHRRRSAWPSIASCSESGRSSRTSCLRSGRRRRSWPPIAAPRRAWAPRRSRTRPCRCRQIKRETGGPPQTVGS